MTAAWNAGARVKRDCACPRARHDHGTWLAYLADECRCPECTEAWVAKATEQRRAEQARARGEQDMRPAAFVPAEPTMLRLRALAVLGHGIPTVTAMIGDRRRNDLDAVRLGKRRFVRRTTHEHIAIVYRRLYATPRIDDKGRWISARARKHGWDARLLLDDDLILADLTIEATDPGEPAVLDEIAIERAIHGQPVPLTPAEREQARPRLEAAGWTARQIADVLGESTRTVQRRRAAA